jgi:hypothetical protein
LLTADFARKISLKHVYYAKFEKAFHDNIARQDLDLGYR